MARFEAGFHLHDLPSCCHAVIWPKVYVSALCAAPSA
jgi:hypothetical protein